MLKYLSGLLVILVFVSCSNGRYKNKLPEIDAEGLNFAPQTYPENSNLPSPAISEYQRELILLKTKNGKYTWMDGTVENGEPFDLKQGLLGKGNQFTPNKMDFPTFAKTGLHSDKELSRTKLITGKSVSQITVDGRPWASSGVGFLAEDETILSVIFADNRTVRKLGLTHADIARPLFHFWNVARDFEKFGTNPETKENIGFESLIYNGNEVKFKIQGSRGWQESIFNDEILGTGHLELWRELNDSETEFLKNQYKELSEKEFEFLKNKISCFHTSEMVFFYINRYGFYEGHNEYRPDPLTVAVVFGLVPIRKAHEAVEGDLLNYYKRHFIQNP
jgi:hypothetical protein